jgi:dienelactone hydrolase
MRREWLNAAVVCFAWASVLLIFPAIAAPVTVPAGTTTREATIDAGDLTLAATLYRPPHAKGRMPAVVIVHGSGPTTREMMSFWTNSVLRAGGVAVLVYDKRGTGESSGSYPQWDVKTTPKMFSDLASDAEHAVRWLADQPAGERGYDPATVLSSLNVPVMWTYGLYDEAIPTHLSIDRIGQLQQEGQTNFDIHIFPFGDHNFYNVFTSERYDLAGVIRVWLERRGITRSPQKPPSRP